ncbi:MAG: hypothetical protein RDU83_10785 [bacterium]|nr:hypothetical protein [bacterium]
MPEPSDRERAVAAYAAEVRAYHVFFGTVLVVIAVLHMAVVFPFLQARAAVPLVAEALARIKQEAESVETAAEAAQKAAGALAEFRDALDSGPATLRRAIADLVARARADAGGQGTIEEAIKQQIGKQVEALGVALDGALGPLRALQNPPAEIAEALRAAEQNLGRHVLALNEVLREAYAADPAFWQRWNGPGTTFGTASPRAGEVLQEIEQARRALERRLTTAAAALRIRQPELAARAAELAARGRNLKERLAGVNSHPWSIPPGLGDLARLFPALSGVLTLLVLFRLRRILALRRAHEGVNLDLLAPSWVVGPRSAPGAWWALILVCAPLVITIHASVATLGDLGLFVSSLGDPSPGSAVAFGAAYAALVLMGIGQLPAVTRGLVGAPQKRQQGKTGRGAAG